MSKHIPINRDPRAHAEAKLYDPIRRYNTKGNVVIDESANTRVAFTSPMEMAKAKAALVAIAPFNRGNSIEKNVCLTVAPRVRDACLYENGILL